MFVVLTEVSRGGFDKLPQFSKHKPILPLDLPHVLFEEFDLDYNRKSMDSFGNPLETVVRNKGLYYWMKVVD
eukprot:scaffold5256_cov192-Ochromonas_danica.AAC.7